MATVAGNPARARDEDAIGIPPENPTLVPAERYYSPAFAALEVQRMWPRVWQLACMVLSSEERRVINMHRNLERYLELPASQQMSGGAPK
jgi:hypothetical protein